LVQLVVVDQALSSGVWPCWATHSWLSPVHVPTPSTTAKALTPGGADESFSALSDAGSMGVEKPSSGSPAANRPGAEFIVFCGVHFMAESADILTSDDQAVILPDMAAGCSMADMAGIGQVEDAWDVLADAGRVAVLAAGRAAATLEKS